jgi:hypothetical protein
MNFAQAPMLIAFAQPFLKSLIWPFCRFQKKEVSHES